MSAQPNPRREELPLPDYDRLTVGTLQHRIRSLGADELETLLGYEHGHADRPQVTRVLDERLGQVRSGGRVSPGGDTPPAGRREPRSGGSKVSPESSPEPMGAPPHGNPAQPARPKANRPK